MRWIEDRVMEMVKTRRVGERGELQGWQRLWSKTIEWLSAALKSRVDAKTPRQMRVLETLTIGPKKQLVLLSCGRDRFLVGTSAEGVQSIVRVRTGVGVSEARVIETVAQDWVR